jgi:hypothetical protein
VRPDDLLESLLVSVAEQQRLAASEPDLPRAVLVDGRPGTGKTSLMAKAVVELARAGGRRAGTGGFMLVRFIGATPESRDEAALLRGLCKQLRRLLGHETRDVHQHLLLVLLRLLAEAQPVAHAPVQARVRVRRDKERDVVRRLVTGQPLEAAVLDAVQLLERVEHYQHGLPPAEGLQERQEDARKYVHVALAERVALDA